MVRGWRSVHKGTVLHSAVLRHLQPLATLPASPLELTGAQDYDSPVRLAGHSDVSNSG
jgi:hypothetical protein